MVQHRLFPAATTPARFNIVLVHGMVEHSGRYDEFAQFLAHQGGNVITFDLRGHGHYKSADLNVLGSFGNLNPNTAQQILTDIEQLFASFKNNLPNILFGHSMGSTIALRYAQTHTGLRQLILTGVPFQSPTQLSIAYQIARLEHHIKGDKLSIFDRIFKQYNRAFKPTQTEFDWLSINATNVRNYINDPLCGYPISTRYYRDMFEFMRLCFRHDEIAKIEKATSILVAWGASDPCTQFGKGTRAFIQRLQRAGLATAQIEYPNMRHEILNEDNRAQVYQDIARLIQA
ncbi:MAG: Lysophospholipase Monoglyceride lipase [Burkholderiaceae bacterium]|nr:Lysophospholipase Monoglyceride lipase [Burkholderiaceae bacterium]